MKTASLIFLYMVTATQIKVTDNDFVNMLVKSSELLLNCFKHSRMVVVGEQLRKEKEMVLTGGSLKYFVICKGLLRKTNVLC